MFGVNILPSDCREEQYPCTRLYSVHKPCKQCLNSLCFYSVRRMYVINKEICVRTVCAHEELLRDRGTSEQNNEAQRRESVCHRWQFSHYISHDASG
uniref:Microfibril associated protein 2 n=1 Tax=Oryzias latipes TaxID=8090 RepID=A0A3P9M162_ORYLA